MLVIALGWAYVVLMMVLAEALGPGGSVLGAIVTALLYGVLPLGIVLYIGGARARVMRTRLASLPAPEGLEPAERRAAERSPAEPSPTGLELGDPGRGSQPPGEPVAPVREEP